MSLVDADTDVDGADVIELCAEEPVVAGGVDAMTVGPLVCDCAKATPADSRSARLRSDGSVRAIVVC